MTEASVTFSGRIADAFLGLDRLVQAVRQPAAGIMRPVNSSISITSPLRTM